MKACAFLTHVPQLLHHRLQVWEGLVDTAQQLTDLDGWDRLLLGCAQSCFQGGL